MHYTKQEIVDILRRAGFREAADEAIAELADEVDFESVQAWAMKRGITRDALISGMGGSP